MATDTTVSFPRNYASGFSHWRRCRSRFARARQDFSRSFSRMASITSTGSTGPSNSTSAWAFQRPLSNTDRPTVIEDEPGDSSTSVLEFVIWWTSERIDHETLKDYTDQHLPNYGNAAFEETDYQDRTALHLAFIHEMPVEFIHALVESMTESQLNQRDYRGRRPLDYMLDGKEIKDNSLFKRVLEKAFVAIEKTEAGNSLEGSRSLLRLCLCRRYRDGDRLLESVWNALHITTDQLNAMLREAISGGSIATVKLLFGKGAELAASKRYFIQDVTETDHETEIDAAMLQSEQARKRSISMLLHMAAGARPPRIDLADLALEDIISIESKIQTRTVPWKASGIVMRRLLNLPHINLNIRNSEGFTPLRYLMASRLHFRLLAGFLKLWLKDEYGADLSGGADPKCRKDALYTSPLAELSRRSDSLHLISMLDNDGVDLFSMLGSTKYNGCLNYMLEGAVRDGSAKMVELLLGKGADANEGEGVLMKYAANSHIEAAEKLVLLREHRANVAYTNSEGFNVLHIAAQSATATADVINRYARTDGDQQQLVIANVNATDKKGNTPLHVAAMNRHQNSDALVQALLEIGGDPYEENFAKDTPFGLVLKFNSSDLDLRRRKVAVLLENGWLPDELVEKQYCRDVAHFRNIFSLDVSTNNHVYRPVKVLLSLAYYCQISERKNIEKNYEEALQWRDLSIRFENEAIDVLEDTAKLRSILYGVMTNDDIKKADDLGWNKFLANENVANLITQMFYCEVDASNAKEIPDAWKLNRWSPTWSKKALFHLPFLIFILCLQALFFPILLLMSYASSKDGKLFEKLLVDPREKPCVTFYGSLTGYLSFLGFLIAHIVLDKTDTAFLWIDRIILLYTIAMVTEEIYQMVTQKKDYFKTITNYIDVIMSTCFIVYFVLKLVGTTHDNLLAFRVSEHVFALAAALSCVLYYLQVNRKLGPIQIAFGEIAIEVLSFMVILGIVLIAFGVAISGTYGAGMHTPEFKNGNVSLPHLVRGLWPSLQTLYWSLYGQIHHEDLTIEHDALLLETIAGLTVFAFWSLASVIVLLNMLIALVNEAFDRDNARVVWTLAVSNIIREIKKSPSFPLPSNFFYLTALFLVKLRHGDCENGCCCPSGKPDDPGRQVSTSLTSPRIQQGRKKRTLSSRSSYKDLSSAGKIQDGTQLHVIEMSKKVHDLSKELKRVTSRLQGFRVREGAASDDEWKAAYLNADVESSEDEEQDAVRCEHARYNLGQQTVCYENQNSSPGGCQFLRTPMSDKLRYFEVLIKDCGKHGRISVGLATRTYHLDRMLGTDEGSVAFHCVDGKLFSGNNPGIKMAIPSQQDDVVGCGIDFDCSDLGMGNSRIFFTVNGEKVGEVTVNFHPSALFPTVGLRSDGETVKVQLSGRWKPSVLDCRKPLYEGRRQNTSSPGIAGNKKIFRMTEGCFRYDTKSRKLTCICTSLRPQICVFQDLSHPITHQFNYFEAKLEGTGEVGGIAVGIAHRKYPLDRIPGFEDGSEAYHCHDGNVFGGQLKKSTFSSAEVGDIIGCGLNFSTKKSQSAKGFFTLNGVIFEEYEVSIPTGGFYPTIGMLSADEEVEFNFNAKWPTTGPALRQFCRVQSRSERVDVANNLLKYTGDSFACVGVYQYLRRRMSREFSYYEVKIKNRGRKGAIGVGLASREYPLNVQPGDLEGSIAWRCDVGGLFLGQLSAEEGDVIGCGLDFERSQAKSPFGKSKVGVTAFTVFFTLNGHKIEEATALVQEPQSGLFPTVGMHSAGAIVQLNTSAVQPEGTRAVNRSMGRFRLSGAEEIRVEGNCVSYIVDRDNDVGGIQLQKSMQDLAYFEVTINSLGERGAIGIGVAHEKCPLDCQLGCMESSIAYHCDDGRIFHCGARVCNDPEKEPSVGDVIGCGIDQKQQIYFTRMRNNLVIEERNFTKQQGSQLYPTICMQSKGDEVKINLRCLPIYSLNRLLSRRESVCIDSEGKRVRYDPDDYNNVGGVQFKHVIKDYPCSYFEVRVHKVGVDGGIGIGLAPSDYPLDCQPGWLAGSIGFLCDGCLLLGVGTGNQIHQPVAEGQRVGCGVDKGRGDKSEVFFAIGGSRIRNSLKCNSPGGDLFPTVGLSSAGAVIEIIENPEIPRRMVSDGAVVGVMENAESHSTLVRTFTMDI